MHLPAANVLPIFLGLLALCGASSCKNRTEAVGPVAMSDGEVQAPPDRQEAERESRERARLSLMVLSCRPVSPKSVRLDFRIYNFGLTAPVKKWRVTLLTKGKTREAAIRQSFDKPIKGGPPQYGFVIAETPGFQFKTKTDLVGIKWNLGYEDPGGLWRWASLGP